MNIDEYRRRVENMHSVTGVPTYWEELQKAIAEAEKWRKIAEMFYARHENRRSCSLLASCKECDAYEKAVRGE